MTHGIAEYLAFPVPVLAPLMERPVTALAWGVFIAGIHVYFCTFPFRRLAREPEKNHPVGKILNLIIPSLFAVSKGYKLICIGTCSMALEIIGHCSNIVVLPDRMIRDRCFCCIRRYDFADFVGKTYAWNMRYFSQIMDWALKFLIIGLLVMLFGAKPQFL